MTETDYRNKQLNAHLDGESQLEKKIDECYERLDGLFGDTCNDIIKEANRLAGIYQIDKDDIIKAFIADKFYIKGTE